VRLTDLRGQWVLVNFWAPWCPLCKVAVPVLNELDKRPDFAVIGIALDYGPDEGKIAEAVNQVGMHFHAIVAGGTRRNPESPHRQVGPVDFFPTSYLYDPSGEIVMFIPGQIRASKILAFMAQWRGAAMAAAKPAFDGDKLAASLKQRYAKKGAQAYADWRKLLDGLAGEGVPGKLARVNDFFNKRIQFASDTQAWGREDYWATPGDLLGAGRGDAEDFAIAKYFTLLAAGLPAERLRLVYAKTGGEARQAAGPVHMVLAYYASASEEPLLLDQRVGEVLPASKRPDIRPVYSFNSLGVWGDVGGQAGVDGNRLAVWEDTLRRARDEGFD
jgi:predicted transglutaminase-like cysteine proteinase